MIYNYKQFLESISYHSLTDVLNLAREIKDFTYNNDCQPTEIFRSIEKTKDGYIIDFSFNGDEKYTITSKKITDKNGIEISPNQSYMNLDMFYNNLQLSINSWNIQQIDESVKYQGLVDGLMEFVKKSSNGKDQEFIRKWVDENSNEEKEKTVTLEGLIQDVDLYDFYLKHKEDIDNILKDNGYFQEHKEHQNVSGLNDYVIDGTKEAIKFCMKEILK
jgi:hypothetical protein